MKKSEYSKTLKYMIKSKKGYRNDSLWGSGVTDIKEIIEFEVNELGNEDILDFCGNMYFKDVEYQNLSTEEKIKAILDKFYLKYPYGLWLTSVRGVQYNYYNSMDEEYIFMNRYNLSKCEFIPISDLGSQGTLFMLNTDTDTIFDKEMHFLSKVYKKEEKAAV